MTDLRHNPGTPTTIWARRALNQPELVARAVHRGTQV
jgi:hypothetical protein